MPTIALVMIARNESRCIRRALLSARPWVDEMVVLDTGSTDDTVAIAREAGARVHHFTWCDDFSAARNAALAHTRSDWRLVLDADEWLANGGQTLAKLSQSSPDFVGSIEVLSQFDQGAGQATASSWLPRLLPRGVSYTGRIHEQPQHALRTRRLPIQIGHDGYLTAPMRAKGDRNRLMLERAVAEAPHDPYLHYQLGKDHEVHDRFDAAWLAYEKALRLLGTAPAREPPWRHDLILRTLYTLKARGQIDAAIELADREMPQWQDSPDFHFVLGDVLLDYAIAHPTEHAQVLPMIEHAWERCLEIGENPDLEGAVQGRGSHLARHNLDLLRDTRATF